MTMASRIMNANNFKQIQRNYDRLSNFYDVLSGKAELLIQRKAVAKLKERKIKKLLDIGCGTGRFLVEVRKSAKQVILPVGIDLSFGMCRKASRQKNSIACANGHTLPFNAAVFDAVTFNFSLEIFPEDCITPLLGECARVLGPDGFICVVSMAKAPGRNVMSSLYLWAHLQFPAVIDCQPISAVQLLGENGFKIIENETCRLWGLPVDIALAKK